MRCMYNKVSHTRRILRSQHLIHTHTPMRYSFFLIHAIERTGRMETTTKTQQRATTSTVDGTHTHHTQFENGYTAVCRCNYYRRTATAKAARILRTNLNPIRLPRVCGLHSRMRLCLVYKCLEYVHRLWLDGNESPHTSAAATPYHHHHWCTVYIISVRG